MEIKEKRSLVAKGVNSLYFHWASQFHGAKKINQKKDVCSGMHNK